MLVLVVSVGSAGAQAKRKVKIETEPAGATVYVGDKENGPACEPTPCTIDVPPGEVILVIEPVTRLSICKVQHVGAGGQDFGRRKNALTLFWLV